MTWSKVEDVVRDLELKSSLNDIEAIKQELRQLMTVLHPDKNGGTFSSKENETKYKRIAEAHDFVCQVKEESKALIPVTQLPAIIKAISELQLVPIQSQSSQLQTEYQSKLQSFLHKRFSLPKIGSGVFAAICTFLFTFNNFIPENSIIKPLLANRIVQMMLLYLIVLSGCFYVLIWIKERREEAKIDYLISEDCRNQIFTFLLTYEKESRRFTFQDVFDQLEFYISRNIPLSLIEKIARIHLFELEKCGVIHRVKEPSISPVYEFNKSVIKK